MYNYFDKYLIRSPLNALDKLEEEFDVNNLDYNFIHSIPFASVDLYDEYCRYCRGEVTDDKKKSKLINSLYKYFIRSCMRCTPFAFFAGVALGNLSNKTELILNNVKYHRAHVRLDMYYIQTLVCEMEKDLVIKQWIKYYTNNSIYVLGDEIRYTDYYYLKNLRKYLISRVDNNYYIDLIIKKAKDGAQIGDMIQLLTNEGIPLYEANEFIESLISNRIIISEFDPLVTGEEFQEYIIKRLCEMGDHKFLPFLKNLKIYLSNLGQNYNFNTDAYDILIKNISKLTDEYNDKFIIQNDLFLSFKKNTINKSIADMVLKGVTVLNKLSIDHGEAIFDNFKKAFLRKYEGQEVSLLEVLDSDFGIGFSQYSETNLTNDESPLINDVIIKKAVTSSIGIKWSKVNRLLLKKYNEYLENRLTQIQIVDEDLIDYPNNWSDLPSTFSVMAKIHNINKETTVFIDKVIGPSAVNLIGRFAHGDKNIEEFIHEIITKEESLLDSDYIEAEIVHLPESRVGNIIIRPIFRNYEIPYMTRSILAEEYQIRLNDIYVVVKNNKVLLKSRKLNKFVLPRLGCAHNFRDNSIPIYRFLSFIQYQGIKNSMFLDWGIVAKELEYLPRVSYKNIVLSLATWKIHKKEIEDILVMNNNTKDILEQFNLLKYKRGIPDNIIFSEGDNDIFIDTNNIRSVQLLLSLMKRRDESIIKEFIFGNYKDSIVKDMANNNYANEIIFSFYKE
ncbi:MAG: lantibiotic dehydratase family protein [Bacteroidales bacterium]